MAASAPPLAPAAAETSSGEAELCGDPRPPYLLNADAPITAVAGDFEFSDSDGDRSRLCMVEGQLCWLVPDGTGSWKTLHEGPLSFNQSTGLLHGRDAKATMSPQDIPRLLQLATLGPPQDITFVGVKSDFEFVDLDGDRNRISMVNGMIQWMTPDSSGGWKSLFSGPSFVLNPGSRELRCGSCRALLSPEDANRLTHSGTLGASPQTPLAAAAAPAAADRVAQPGAPAAQPMTAPQPVVMNAHSAVTAASGPVLVTCPRCNSQVTTQVNHEMGTGSWATCACLCCFGVGVLSCAGLLPCCVKECQDAHHQCPACREKLGTKTFLF